MSNQNSPENDIPLSTIEKGEEDDGISPVPAMILSSPSAAKEAIVTNANNPKSELLETPIPIATSGSLILYNRLIRKSQIFLNALLFTVGDAWFSVILATSNSIDENERENSNLLNLWIYAFIANLIIFIIVCILVYVDKKLFQRALKDSSGSEESIYKHVISKVVSKMIDSLGDAIVYVGAVAINGAVRESIPKGNVGWIWLYAILLSVIAVLLIVFFNRYATIIANKLTKLAETLQIGIKKEEQDTLVQQEIFEKISLFVLGSLGWLTALGLMDAVDLSLDERIDRTQRRKVG